MKRLFAAAALATAGFTAYSADSSSLASQMAACGDQLASSRFDVIRRVFPLGSSDVTQEMLGSRTYPNSSQKETLRLYRNTVVACSRKAIDESVGITAEGERSRAADDLQLDLLMTGRMTFAEYALLKKVRSDTFDFWMGELKKQQANATGPRPMAGLVCVLENGQAAGLEIFVQFDEATNKVWANRGGQITKSWIDATTVGYEQNQSTFAISRLTGRVMWSSPNGGILSTGQCKTGATQKF